MALADPLGSCFTSVFLISLLCFPSVGLFVIEFCTRPGVFSGPWLHLTVSWEGIWEYSGEGGLGQALLSSSGLQDSGGGAAGSCGSAPPFSGWSARRLRAAARSGRRRRALVLPRCLCPFRRLLVSGPGHFLFLSFFFSVLIEMS